MRTVVLLVMIALLPLRMWAADGMAVRMAQAEAVTAAHAQGQAAMPDDCPMMANAGAADHGSQDAPPGQGHAACLTCVFCAALAATGTPVAGGPAPAATPAPRGSASFASAEPRAVLKPPIS